MEQLLESITKDANVVPCLEAALMASARDPGKLGLDAAQSAYRQTVEDAQRRGGGDALKLLMPQSAYELRKANAKWVLARQRAIVALAKHESGQGIVLLRRAAKMLAESPEADGGDRALLQLIEEAIGPTP